VYSLSNLWNREPAVILAIINAVVVLAVSFGLNLSKEQTAAILVLATLIVNGFATRSQVSPTP
jgi:hypothetical protein